MSELKRALVEIVVRWRQSDETPERLIDRLLSRLAEAGLDEGVIDAMERAYNAERTRERDEAQKRLRDWSAIATSDVAIHQARAEAAERERDDLRARVERLAELNDRAIEGKAAAERERDEERVRYEGWAEEIKSVVAEWKARAEAAVAIERECAALRDALTDMRCKLHAANRPVLRQGLRLELRDQIDAALAPRPPETRHARNCAYVTTDGPAPCTCGAGG